jgi:HD-GYP domain-containing protein (c-di-GMP phosphodiesterase class II)
MPGLPAGLIERTRVTPMPSCSRPLRVVVVRDSQDEAVRRLLDLAADSAPDVAAHMERTARLATALVKSLELGEPLARIVVLTARLHDIGKLGIPPWVLEKPGPLSELESRMMREHSVVGQRMLERRTELLAFGPLVRATHERWDGLGYPDRLRGALIPLPARIVAVCDAFDAMTRPRSYSGSISIAAALDELHRCAGSQFDPGVVAAFRELLEGRFDQLAQGA